MGLNHDFWILRVEDLPADTGIFWGRRDAPLKIHDELLDTFWHTLTPIPTFNPGRDEPCFGLNRWGPTIINDAGGVLLYEVCSAWVHLFALAPEHFAWHKYYQWEWPFEEDERLLSLAEIQAMGHNEYFRIKRTILVDRLNKLATYGKLAATGEYVILHIGI